MRKIHWLCRAELRTVRNVRNVDDLIFEKLKCIPCRASSVKSAASRTHVWAVSDSKQRTEKGFDLIASYEFGAVQRSKHFT